MASPYPDRQTPKGPRRTLTARFVSSILLIALVTGGTVLVLFDLITGHVRETLGRDLVGKQALYDKSRLELPIQHEVALALQLARSPTLKAWSRQPGDASLRDRAMAELESYRQSFQDRSYFFVPHRTLEFYFKDERSGGSQGQVAYTLEREKPKDEWYFTTLAHPEAFSLNVDYDEKLELTKIWINTNVRDGEVPLGVVGTGFDLGAFIETFIGGTKPGVTSFLLDASGAVQAHKDPAYIDENSQTKAPEQRKTVFRLLDSPTDRAAFAARMERLVHGESQVETLFVDLEGTPVLAGICYLPDLRWFNVTTFEVDALASSGAFFPVVLLLAFSLVAIVLAVLALMRSMVLTPLSQLARSTASIMAGGDEDALGPGRDDEIGLLMETFSRMRATVRETLAGMEDKVRERTAALEAARETAEEANQAKGEFLANTSHELRTPLNAVLGLLQLALATELTPQQREDLTKAKEAAESLLAILNDILDFSKIEAGKLELEVREFDLEATLKSVLAMTFEPARLKGLDLVYRLDPALPRTVRGDPLRVQQVLLNLVSNAVKFTERGEVVVSAAPGPEPEMIAFSVRDTGIGIASDLQAALFRPFTQADTSTTRQFGGTGLGLSICRSLVELMGGALTLESKPEAGSWLGFALPLPTAKAEKLVPRDEALTGKAAVAVVGNEEARRNLAELLTALGLAPRLASTRAAGEELLANADPPPALLLLDWETCGGVAGARRLLEAAPGEEPPRVVVLTYDLADVGGELTCELVAKPVLPSGLADIVRRALVPTGVEPATPVARTGPPLPSLEPIRGARILLVEDNRVNQQIVTRVLRSHGLEVEVAADGAEALERVDEGFDGVLMDIQMPRMNGYEATRELRRRFDADRLPIIAMSANAMESDRDLCREAGMNGHVAKPVEFPSFFRTLLELIRPPADAGSALSSAGSATEGPDAPARPSRRPQ